MERACRLKDINELFYDTGIGKEGYSIIGQGQIDKILSGKPEERRELFDEAAGIVKFKRRKAATHQEAGGGAGRTWCVSTDIIKRSWTRQIGPLETSVGDGQGSILPGEIRSGKAVRCEQLPSGNRGDSRGQLKDLEDKQDTAAESRTGREPEQSLYEAD